MTIFFLFFFVWTTADKLPFFFPLLKSVSRTYIKDLKLFGTGKAAFRFLIPREAVLADPATKSIGEIRKGLVGWYGSDRRVIMYACNNDELLNFVCIHPDTESHAAHSDGKL